ncbi:MAG: hypothetical protein ABFS03_11515 [Chloroflexota bacterium]
MIRSKQISSSINYWVSMFGYNVRDRSASAGVYLFYLVVILSAWTLAIMFYLSDFIANSLSPYLASLGIVFTDSITTIVMLLLALWFLYSIYKATNRSSLVFSKDDAHHICQTPVERRFVTMVWFFGNWPTSIWLLLGAAITIGFALLEIDVHHGIKVLSAKNLIIAGLKPIIILIPVQMALFAAIWMIGVFRLQGGNQRIKEIRVIRVLVLISGTALFVISLGDILFPPSFTFAQPILSLLTMPFNRAFFAGGWYPGFAISFGLMILSLAFLWRISKNTNLSRAAQETKHVQAQRAALGIGNFDRVRGMKNRERLGSMHAPTKIPSFPGAWMVTWKEILQSLRPLTLARLWDWVNIFLFTITGAAAGKIFNDKSTVLFFAVYWTLMVGRQTSLSFKNELGNWWIVQSLPLSPKRIILHNILRSYAGTIIVTWLGLGMSSMIGIPISPIVVYSVPFAAAGIAISFILDMLRKADISLLLIGKTPDFGFPGLILGVFFIAIPAMISMIAVNYALSPMTGMLAVMLLSVPLVILLFHLAERQFRSVG